MKKVLVIILIVLVGGVIWWGINRTETFPTAAVPADWVTFEDQEVGIRFKYPPNLQIATSSENPEFDKGAIRSFFVGDFNAQGATISFAVTSPDFAEGAGEGCCGYYVGRPISELGTMKEVATVLTEQFAKIAPLMDMEYFALNENKGVRFRMIGGYTSYWLQNVFVFPVRGHEPFTNVVIVSPTIASTPDDSRLTPDQNHALLENLKKTTNLTTNQELFEKILKTVEFF